MNYLSTTLFGLFVFNWIHLFVTNEQINSVLKKAGLYHKRPNYFIYFRFFYNSQQLQELIVSTKNESEKKKIQVLKSRYELGQIFTFAVFFLWIMSAVVNNGAS